MPESWIWECQQELAYAVITEVAESNLFNERLLQCLLVHQSAVWDGVRKWSLNSDKWVMCRIVFSIMISVPILRKMELKS